MTSFGLTGLTGPTASSGCGTEPSPWRDRRNWALLVCLALIALAAAFATFATMAMPVAMPLGSVAEAHRYWPTAAIGAALVVLIDGLVIGLGLARQRRLPPVVRRWAARSQVLAAFFVAVTVLQLGHLGEHTVQVTQLLLTHGDLSQSHGLVGQFDFETIHFVWDSAVWLSICFLLYRLPGNRWLWVAFLAASVHEVEHVYLFWAYLAAHGWYLRGGVDGVFGRGGVLTTPLYRPYLHFFYNALVALPLAYAFWQHRARRRASGPHMPLVEVPAHTEPAR
jgi:hypothetical protein